MDRPETNSRSTALVTGAGARLGKAMAEALGKTGWNVAVHYARSEAGANQTAEAIRTAGGKAVIVQADLSNEADTGTLIAKATAALGAPVTLLVNSASTFFDDTAKTHARKDWDGHMEVNFRAPVHLSQCFAQALPEGMKGSIVNLIDQRVLKLNPQFFTYTLSKSALWSATRTMAQTFAPHIRVNAIGPGPTLRSIHQSAKDFTAEAEATLTREGSNPSAIIHALTYLIEADTVTGQMIAADGGQHLLWQTPDIVID